MGHGRNGSADLNVCARTHTGCGAARTFRLALRFLFYSLENVAHPMVPFLGIPRKRRFLKSAEHIYVVEYERRTTVCKN